MEKAAVLSECKRYRYLMSRIWKEEDGLVNFIGLNPSTADAEVDDHTIRCMVRFAMQWGYGGILVTNLSAERATKPKELSGDSFQVDDDVNNRYIIETAARSSQIVACWGAFDKAQHRGRAMTDLLSDKTLWCLKFTKYGGPKHPLYIKRDTKLQIYREASKG